MATAHLLSTLLPVGSVQLGRLVLDAKNPSQEFIDPLSDRPEEAEFHRSQYENFTETQRFSKCSKLRQSLNGTLQFSFEDADSTTATITASEATTYDLLNPGDWFDSACKEPETRRFIEKAVDNRRSVYLVVGFRSVKNAKVVGDASGKKARKKARKTKGNNPVPSSVPPGGIISNIGPSGELANGPTGGQEHSIGALEEQVFAVLYRKARVEFLSTQDAGGVSLEANNRWVSYWGWRNPSEQDDDVMEVDLVEDSDMDISDDEFSSEDELDNDPLESSGAVGVGGLQDVQRLPEITSGCGDTEGIKGDTGNPNGKLGTIPQKKPSEDGFEEMIILMVVWGLGSFFLLFLCRWLILCVWTILRNTYRGLIHRLWGAPFLSFRPLFYWRV